MTIGERIKKARKELDLTQQKFADRLGMKQNTVATYEMNRTNPSDPAIKSICREFNISETWLRTGAGEMFIQPQGREEEIQHMVGNLLQGRKAEFKYRLISVLNNLNEDQWEVLEGYMKKIVGDQEEPPQPTTTPDKTLEQEVDQEVERYRQQLLSEKKQASQALSAKESDVG